MDSIVIKGLKIFAHHGVLHGISLGCIKWAQRSGKIQWPGHAPLARHGDNGDAGEGVKSGVGHGGHS